MVILALRIAKHLPNIMSTIVLSDASANTEPDFKNEVLDVVDGQQRLTTMALFAIAFLENISELKLRTKSKTDNFSPDLKL